MPAYNERATIREILRRVSEQPEVTEIVVVDDCSRDGTREILSRLSQPNLKVVLHPENRGKGAALRTGFEHVTGELTIVQDADLEYDPRDYARLLAKMEETGADVVYGSRFATWPRRRYHQWHSVSNRILTLISNLTTNLRITDMETCYKLFRTDVLRSIRLRAERFGFEPEVTAKVAKLGCRVVEVPVWYRGRSKAEGKKIGLRDAFHAVGLMLRYAFFDD